MTITMIDLLPKAGSIIEVVTGNRDCCISAYTVKIHPELTSGLVLAALQSRDIGTLLCPSLHGHDPPSSLLTDWSVYYL